MEWIKNLIAKLVGKQVDGQIGASKTKIVAVVAVIMLAVQTLPQAFGHPPIVIPDVVYRFLEAAGLWTLRSALPDGEPKKV